MGLHPSLKRGDGLATTRSVMKRSERIKWLKAKGLWTKDMRVLGLPKIKTIKLKSTKKTKEEKQEDAKADKDKKA
ncbi:MAG: small basic protein [Candidatus Omnitrophica bacterium]|nr:small basic protein [Candidatus Omnitrophota bacterium]